MPAFFAMRLQMKSAYGKLHGPPRSVSCPPPLTIKRSNDLRIRYDSTRKASSPNAALGRRTAGFLVFLNQFLSLFPPGWVDSLVAGLRPIFHLYLRMG